MITRVLDLPATERAELARHLLRSLETPDADADADQAWADEIDARLERSDSSTADDWQIVLERIRNSLRRNGAK
jgi:putative addiction module component (TIGR02574 family)